MKKPKFPPQLRKDVKFLPDDAVWVASFGMGSSHRCKECGQSVFASSWSHYTERVRGYTFRGPNLEVFYIVGDQSVGQMNIFGTEKEVLTYIKKREKEGKR